MFLASWCRYSKKLLLMTNSVGLHFNFMQNGQCYENASLFFYFFGSLSSQSAVKDKPEPMEHGNTNMPIKATNLLGLLLCLFNVHHPSAISPHTRNFLTIIIFAREDKLPQEQLLPPSFFFFFFFMDTKFSTNVNWNSTLYVSGRLIMEINGAVSRPH